MNSEKLSLLISEWRRRKRCAIVIDERKGGRGLPQLHLKCRGRRKDSNSCGKSA